MIEICCGCKKFIRLKKPILKMQKTHGWCKICHKKEIRKIDNLAVNRKHKKHKG